MANANVDAEKLVFALDIISFFMKKHYPAEDFAFKIANVVDNYRPHVRQHFSENLKKKLDNIDETQSYIVQKDFSEMQQKEGEMNLPSLIKYIDSFKNCNIREMFSAENFLLLCARISLMSCLFFVSGRKSDLDYAIDLINNSFPDNEEECKVLWDAINNVAENYGSNFQGNETSFSEPVDSLNRAEGSCKSDIQGNETSPLSDRGAEVAADAISSAAEGNNRSDSQKNETSAVFGKYARISADFISSATENSNDPQVNATPDVAHNEYREIADGSSSWTEDSCSSSSNTNTDSDSSANTQNMSSASSDESLHRLILKLNRRADERSGNSAPAAASGCSACAAASNIGFKNVATVSNTGFENVATVSNIGSANAADSSNKRYEKLAADSSNKRFEKPAADSSNKRHEKPTADSSNKRYEKPAADSSNKGCAKPDAAVASNKGCAKPDAAVASNKGRANPDIAVAPNAESVKYVKSKQNTTTISAAFGSSTEIIKDVEIKQSTTENNPTENLGSNIQNLSVSSSTSNKLPKIDIDFKTRIERAFMEVEDESSQKSPLKSFLGKRPSPEIIKDVEIKQSATENVPTENLESNIQNLLASSSTFKLPKIEIDFKTRIENAFIEVENESSQKSPIKSLLGKRPSPRKVSFSKDTGGDESEAEIKKTKIGTPESKD